MSDIKVGDLTNKGIVKMADAHSELVLDRIVITTQGTYRESDLIKLEKASKPTPREMKAQVSFETVMFVDIRPGRVISSERIKEGRFIHLVVETSLGKKNVVTNLGSEYAPDVFMNRTFMFVMNMPPTKISGVMSEAMIIASGFKKFEESTNTYVDASTLMPINIGIDHIIL